MGIKSVAYATTMGMRMETEALTEVSLGSSLNWIHRLIFLNMLRKIESFMLKKGWPALFSKRHYIDLLPGSCRHKGYIKRANSPVGKTVVDRTLMIRVKADLMRPVMVTLQNKKESNRTIYVQVFLITNIKNDTLVIKHH